MKMAFVLFDGMTTLDMAGFHNAVTWLHKKGYRDDLSWEFCGPAPMVEDDRGMRIQTDRILPHLSEFDLVFIPGGMATRTLIHDDAFMDWIRTAETVAYKVSVCTGALILGKAGFAEGRTITTNPLAYDELKPYCTKVARERFVRDGNLFTGGGITASVDLGLFFVESLYGLPIAQEIKTLMDYPFYRSGNV